MTETQNLFSNLDHAAKSIGGEIKSHPWDAILALTHLPVDGGASAAEMTTRAVAQSGSTKDRSHENNHPSSSLLPKLELAHSNALAAITQGAQNALHEVATNPLVAASLGPVGISVYEQHHIDTYVQSHGGVSNIFPGVTRVTKALAKGAINEAVKHPGELAAASASGALINQLARIPYVNGAIALGGAAYVGWEVYKHGGEWMHDLDVTYYQNGRSASEIKNANIGLQHDGKGLALMGAGGLGAGLSGAVVSGVEGMLARRAMTASVNALGAAADSAAPEGTAAAQSMAAQNLEAVGQPSANRETAQSFQAANESPNVIRMHSANQNEEMMHQAQAVNGSPTRGAWSTGSSGSSGGHSWTEAKVGNSNQDRFTTPEDRMWANQAARKAASADEWSKTQNFKDLGLEDLAHSKGLGKLGVQVAEVLGRNHIHSTQELTSRSEQSLLNLPGITPKYTALIKEALAKQGLHLTSEVPPPITYESEFNKFPFSHRPSMDARITNILHEQGIFNFDNLAAKLKSGELQQVKGLNGITLSFVEKTLFEKGYSLP